MNKLKTALLSTAVLSTAYLSPSVLASQLDEATVSKTDFNSVSKTFDNTAQQSTNGKGIKQIDVAIWSEENDQDDLKWYSANAITEDQASVQFHLANHGNRAGNYVTHVYTTYLDGNRSGLVLDNTKITPSAPQVSVKDGVIQLTTEIYAPSNGQVKYAIWSEENGQDDIKWYKAEKAADGSYTYTFYAKNHNFESGHYNVHVYGVSEVTHSLVGLATTSGIDLTFNQNLTAPTVTVQNHDADKGTLQVKVSECTTSKVIQVIRVAAWSESDQSNLHWYTTSNLVDGSATVTVDEKYHGYIKGDYTVHVYVDFKDGTTSGFNLGQYNFNAEKPVDQTASYFVDISSHNGVISVNEFVSLKNQGITGVVVKLTEGTSYTNPYASAQIKNAQDAGLKVSAYHYSHYQTEAEAKAEAKYFVSAAQSLGLSNATVMVNDMESPEMVTGGDINKNTQAWKEEMIRLGYADLVYYTMASWLDTKGGAVNTSQFGMDNFWVAHYVYGYNYLDQETAKELSYYSDAAAWQYTSVSPKLPHALDENIDYTGRFTL